jgi:hypothetical protein
VPWLDRFSIYVRERSIGLCQKPLSRYSGDERSPILAREHRRANAEPASKLDSATSEVLFHGTATCRDADTNEIIAELDFRPISPTVTAKPWSDPTSNPMT